MRFTFSLALLLLLAAPAVHATDERYRDMLVVEQASGLAGAFIAISDDPSGVLYNPAGIVFGMENYFSLSANVFEKSVRVYKNALQGQDYTYTSSSIIPTFFGLTQSLGKGKLGFAIIVPSQENYDQNDSKGGLSTAANDANILKRRFLDQDTTYMAGPAYAYEVAKDLTMGLSVLGVYRTRKVIDNQLILFNSTRYVLDEKTIDQATYGLYPKFGMQYMPLPKFSFGATLAKTFTLQSDRHVHSVDVDTTNTSNPVETDSTSSPKLVSPVEL